MGYALGNDFVVISNNGEQRLKWLSDSPQPTEQEITAAELPMLRAAKIAETKAEASTRIYTIAPAWKQANLQATASMLLYIQVSGGTLTPEQQAMQSGLIAAQDAINDIRAASDLIEEEINESAAPEIIDVATNPLWP